MLDGTYRVVYEFTKQTANGAPATGTAVDETYWWAFRSSCTSAGCVATGAGLDDTNHQEATGRNEQILHFADGHWQNTTAALVDSPCPGAKHPGVNQSLTRSWSLTPQSDGTLRGVETQTALTDECGKQGYVWQTPLAVTHEGDVAPTVMVADPALFMTPPAPVAAPTPSTAGRQRYRSTTGGAAYAAIRYLSRRWAPHMPQSNGHRITGGLSGRARKSQT